MNTEQKTEQKVELDGEQLKAVAGGALGAVAGDFAVVDAGVAEKVNLGDELKLGRISHW